MRKLLSKWTEPPTRRRSGRFARAAFTLIEILLVLLIIAMLFAIIIPNFLRARFQAELSACEENEAGIAKGLEIYFTQNQQYPNAPLTTDFYTNYIGKQPVCPLGGNLYNYTISSDLPYTYTIICGAPHSQVTQIGAGYPQYTLGSGLQTGL